MRIGVTGRKTCDNIADYDQNIAPTLLTAGFYMTRHGRMMGRISISVTVIL
jgi:hypothetical protein